MNYTEAHLMLPEVSSPAPRDALPAADFVSFWPEPEPTPAAPAISQEDLEAAIVRVQEAARRSAAQQLAEREAETAAMLDSALRTAREEWAAETAERLASAVASAFAEVRREIATSLVEAVLPLVAREFRRRAVEDLAAAAEVAIGPDRHLEVRVRGPQDLMDQLSKRLESRAIAHVCEAGTPAQLEVHVNRTALVVETDRFVQRLDELTA